MKEYEEFKAAYMAENINGISLIPDNIVTLLKKNACLVEIIHGAKGLAEDIFANALEIERTFPIKSWPKFEEDGEFVKLGDASYGFNGLFEVMSIEVSETGWTLYGVHKDKKYIINQGNKGDYAQKTYALARDYQEYPDCEPGRGNE